jgi:hypothetical protein
MTPERWKQIDRLFEAALELEGDKRSAFLEQACAGDAQLNHKGRSISVVGKSLSGTCALACQFENGSAARKPSLRSSFCAIG